MDIPLGLCQTNKQRGFEDDLAGLTAPALEVSGKLFKEKKKMLFMPDTIFPMSLCCRYLPKLTVEFTRSQCRQCSRNPDLTCTPSLSFPYSSPTHPCTLQTRLEHALLITGNLLNSFCLFVSGDPAKDDDMNPQEV